MISCVSFIISDYVTHGAERIYCIPFCPIRLKDVYPALFKKINATSDDPALFNATSDPILIPFSGISASEQAINQLIASIITLVIAVVGGASTGNRQILAI